MRTDSYCLAIDQGSYSSRAVIYDQQGNDVFTAQRPIDLHRLDQSRVEQNADQILGSVLHVIDQCRLQALSRNFAIRCAGIATQRSSIVAWRRSTGEALSPVLSWQDTRAASSLTSLEPCQQEICQRTGLRLSAHYGASKIRWLVDNLATVQHAIQQQDCLVTPIASYLLFHLTQQRNIAIDAANASRTLLFNIHQHDWDSVLLDYFDINRQWLPDVFPTEHHYGTLEFQSIPIVAINGDQNAALHDQGTPSPKSIRVNLGTGAFALTPSDHESIQTQEFLDSRLLAGVSGNTYKHDNFYIEGTVNGAASALDWFQSNYPDCHTQAVPDMSDQSEPPLFINSVGGLGSPLWRHDISPRFVDFSPSAQQCNLAMAAILESIVFLLMLNIERIRLFQSGIDSIHIGGGLSNNHYLCQCLCDLAGLPILDYGHSEATSKGIAWLAFRASGLILDWHRDSAETIYSMNRNLTLNRRYERFKSCLSEYHLL